MNIYATTTSERASKGQGGKYIEVEIKNKQKEICAKILITPSKDFEHPINIRVDYDRYKVESIERIPWEWGNNIKGKKKKGEDVELHNCMQHAKCTVCERKI